MAKRTIAELQRCNRRASYILTMFMAVLLTGMGECVALPCTRHYAWIGALVGFVIAVCAALIGWLWGSESFLEWVSARRASRNDFQVLRNVVDEVSVAAGIPAPRVYVINDSNPNSFAAGFPDGAGIIVTTGLLQTLERDELQAVIGHEVAHIRNGDVRFMTMVVFLAGLVPLLCEILWEILTNGFSFISDGWGVLFFASSGIAVTLLWILSPLFTVVLKNAIGHKREFLADATAVEITRNPTALINALRKVAGSSRVGGCAKRTTACLCFVDPTGRNGASHPAADARIRALGDMMGVNRNIVLGENASRMR